MKGSNLDRYHLYKDQPEKLQFSLYTLREYLRENVTLSTQPHIHSFYQIIWFYEGTGQHQVDFQSYAVHPHTLFFIAKDQVHAFDHETYEGVLLHFNESFLVHYAPDIDIVLKYNIFNNYQLDPCVQLPPELIPTLSTLMSQMEQELTYQNQFGTKDLLTYLTKAFLILIERLHRQTDPLHAIYRVSDEKHVQFLRFRELLENHFKKGTTVSAYADLLNLSPKSLTDLTNKLAHKTPSQLIQERVILEAKRLLVHSSLSIKEIGYSLSFEDPSYFVKYFKKYTQMTPRAFRESTS